MEISSGNHGIRIIFVAVPATKGQAIYSSQFRRKDTIAMVCSATLGEIGTKPLSIIPEEAREDLKGHAGSHPANRIPAFPIQGRVVDPHVSHDFLFERDKKISAGWAMPPCED